MKEENKQINTTGKPRLCCQRKQGKEGKPSMSGIKDGAWLQNPQVSAENKGALG